MSIWKKSTDTANQSTSRQARNELSRKDRFLKVIQNGTVLGLKQVMKQDRIDLQANDTELGNEALRRASGSGRLDMVQHLIETYGVDPEAKHQNGCTPLHYAVRRSLEIVQYLIEVCHVNVEAKEILSGRTPLHVACGFGKNLEIVQYLVETGHADLEAKDHRGWTVLHHAGCGNHFEIVQYLIHTCHVDVEAKDNEGLTVLQIVRNDTYRYGRDTSRVVEYLEYRYAMIGGVPLLTRSVTQLQQRQTPPMTKQQQAEPPIAHCPTMSPLDQKPSKGESVSATRKGNVAIIKELWCRLVRRGRSIVRGRNPRKRL